ncbi:hypothetical protein Mal64_23060 [Pseudobythopirellula maris]|uniref:Uncharacterized protein n=1 Tax=Pseudobythopirellula maris TaxID=2527991 RepID=A0A5C5ZNQ5_9BACT|nr:hypothetical protein [Pseudobythopirellula maris]TWT88818.1 hypothetical protein Mal64_23060 [Pseudobythopirellula maris]
MIRFSIRSLLIVTALLGAYFAVGQQLGYLAATGVALAATILGWAWACRLRGWWRWARVLVVLPALVLLWFTAFDSLWVIKECPTCYAQHDVQLYRFLGAPIVSDSYQDPNVMTLALADLGDPCTHDRMESSVKHRYWGNIICAYPCVSGTFGLCCGSDVYTKTVSTRVRGYAMKEPQLAADVHKRVVENGGREFFYDAFMVDQFVLAAIEDGAAIDAITWLEDSKTDQLRMVECSSNALDNERSTQLVRDLQANGAVEVLAYWMNGPDIDNEVQANLAIRLPAEESARSPLFEYVHQHTESTWFDDDRPKDYGQEFIRF